MMILLMLPVMSGYKWGADNTNPGAAVPTTATWKPVIKGRRR